jgi:hypothetical protein
VNASAKFWNWLRSDWGSPNFLTRAGIPRIVTNLLTYLLAPIAFYLLTARYVPSADKRRFNLVVHNPFFLFAYATFYVTVVTNWFLEFSYNLKTLRPRERFQVIRQNSRDIFVRIYWISAAVSVFLFLLGTLYFRHQLRP